jgi:hypothetical protein
MLPYSETLALCPWPQKAGVANQERRGRQRPLSGFDSTLAKSAAFVQSQVTQRSGIDWNSAVANASATSTSSESALTGDIMLDFKTSPPETRGFQDPPPEARA